MAEGKLTPALEECGIEMPDEEEEEEDEERMCRNVLNTAQCVLSNLKWFDEESQEFDRVTILEDLESMPISETMLEAEGLCFGLTEEINVDFLEKVLVDGDCGTLKVRFQYLLLVITLRIQLEFRKLLTKLRTLLMSSLMETMKRKRKKIRQWFLISKFSRI